MMQSNTNGQKRSTQMGKKKSSLDDQNELLPQRGRPTGGNFNPRSSNNQLVRRDNNAVELLPTRGVRRNMPPRGRRFEPGSGNFDRRGPIPELEPLPGRRNERPLRYVVVPSHNFDGAVISDDENEEEEREYLPNHLFMR